MYLLLLKNSIERYLGLQLLGNLTRENHYSLLICFWQFFCFGIISCDTLKDEDIFEKIIGLLSFHIFAIEETHYQDRKINK